MKTLFRTKVVSGKGATQHRLGIGETRRPEIVQLTICEGSGGIFLLYEDDQGSVFDTWHETVDQAKSQAAHEYDTTGWVSVPP